MYTHFLDLSTKDEGLGNSNTLIALSTSSIKCKDDIVPWKGRWVLYPQERMLEATMKDVPYGKQYMHTGFFHFIRGFLKLLHLEIQA